MRDIPSSWDPFFPSLKEPPSVELHFYPKGGAYYSGEFYPVNNIFFLISDSRPPSTRFIVKLFIPRGEKLLVYIEVRLWAKKGVEIEGLKSE